MENLDNIDRHLKDSLESYTLPPRLDSFEQVMLRLQKEKRRRLFIFFLLPLAGILLLAGLLLVTPDFEVQHAQKISETAGAKTGSLPEISGSPITLEAPSAQGHPSGPAKSSLQNPETEVRTQPATTPPPRSAGHHPSPVAREETASEQPATLPMPTATPESYLFLQHPDTTGTLAVTALPPHRLLLPQTGDEQTVVIVAPEIIPPVPEEPQKKKNSYSFFIGGEFSPQIARLHLRENNDRNVFYDMPPGQEYVAAYLNHRKEKNTFNYNFAFGLKGGLVINDKWELLAGAGFHQIRYREELLLHFPPAPAPTYGALNSAATAKSGFVYNSQEASDGTAILNRFRYLFFALEAGKIHTLRRTMKIKTSAGMQGGYLRRTSYGYVDGARRLLFTPYLKMGFMEDVGTRLRFQACPYLFYTGSSMFTKDYMIRQNNFGLGLECLMLFRLQ